MGNAAVSWVSQLQKVETISTTEAEYLVVIEACKELIWLKGLMKELGKEQEDCILFSNNQSAIHLSNNSVFHSRMKHIDIKYHFIRSLLEEDQLRLEKIHTKENPADMLTKAVNIEKLKLCATSVGLEA